MARCLCWKQWHNLRTAPVFSIGETPQEYKAAFDEKDTKITADIQETVMEAHPQREEVEACFTMKVKTWYIFLNVWQTF